MSLSGFDIIVNMIEAAIVVWLVSHYLTMKPGIRFGHIALFYAVLLAEGLIFSMAGAFDISMTILASITILVFSLLASTNNIIEKVVFSWAVMIVILVLNMFSMLITGAVFRQSIMAVVLSSGLDRIASVVISKTLLLGASVFLVHLRRSIKSTFLSVHWWQFTIQSVLGMLCLSILINFLYHREFDYLLLVIAIFLLIALMLLIYFLFIRIQIEEKRRYEDMLLIKELSYHKKSIDDMMALSEEMKKYRHDIKHVLSTAIGLAENDRSEEAVKLLTQYSQEIDSLHDYIVTGNAALDYILNSKIASGMKQGIRFKTLYVATRLCMDIDDLCVLVGNALDNAIENCSGADREVIIEFRDVHEYTSLRIENTIEKSIMEVNPMLASTKPESELHGYGIKSMKYIAGKYNGDVEFREEDGKFICQILFQC